MSANRYATFVVVLVGAVYFAVIGEPFIATLLFAPIILGLTLWWGVARYYKRRAAEEAAEER